MCLESPTAAPNNDIRTRNSGGVKNYSIVLDILNLEANTVQLSSLISVLVLEASVCVCVCFFFFSHQGLLRKLEDVSCQLPARNGERGGDDRMFSIFLFRFCFFPLQLLASFPRALPHPPPSPPRLKYTAEEVSQMVKQRQDEGVAFNNIGLSRIKLGNSLEAAIAEGRQDEADIFREQLAKVRG